MGKKKTFFFSAVILVVFFSFWELVSTLQWVNPLFIPPFSKIVRSTFNMLIHKNLLNDIATSAGRAAAGTVLAVVFGVPAGLVLALPYRALKTVLGSFTDVLSQVNPFILFHILILFLGIGEEVKITIVVWSAVWPIMFNTASGIEDSDRLLFKAGRAFGGGRLVFFRKIVLPAAAPKIFSGIRIGAGYSLFMLIAAEMMGGKSGLGWQILNYQSSFQIESIFSAALVIALLGIVFDGVILGIQKICLRGQE
ncbi:MAG: ABC transporter permease [Treponema sp.]|jgi:NitT/TauT family transport system permease protein|nr:ABC transporter permease [Treponema sp.]